MTLDQMAVAAGADLKWLQNAAGILQKKLIPTHAEAYWWGTVKRLSEALDIPLRKAETMANSLRGPDMVYGQRAFENDPTGVTSVTVDMDRLNSIFLANVSCALNLHTPKRRGRPEPIGDALDKAREHGIEISLLEAALNRSPDERLQILKTSRERVKKPKRAK